MRCEIKHPRFFCFVWYMLNNCKSTNNKHKQKMKQKENSLKRQNYEPPKVEIINLEIQGVLCASALQGNTENVTVEVFVYP